MLITNNHNLIKLKKILSNRSISTCIDCELDNLLLTFLERAADEVKRCIKI